MRTMNAGLARSLARVRADRARIIRDFKTAVNMSVRELAAWLETEESHRAGWRGGANEESVGHRSGRRIVEILRTKPDRLSDWDLMHMRTVVGFVRRHLAQRPRKDVATSRWAHSLKNWGHDPTRKTRASR